MFSLVPHLRKEMALCSSVCKGLSITLALNFHGDVQLCTKGDGKEENPNVLPKFCLFVTTRGKVLSEEILSAPYTDTPRMSDDLSLHSSFRNFSLT